MANVIVHVVHIAVKGSLGSVIPREEAFSEDKDVEVEPAVVVVVAVEVDGV